MWYHIIIKFQSMLTLIGFWLLMFLFTDTKHILSNALRHLTENPDMKFIWAEISYFSRFYEDLGENKKQQMKA